MGLQWGVCGAGKVLFIDVGAGYSGEALCENPLS